MRVEGTIFWAATIIASLIVVAVVISYVINSAEGVPVAPIIPLLIAGVIWLVGWTFRKRSP